MKLLIEPDTYPLKFVIFGGSNDFGGFIRELEKLGADMDEVRECLTSMVDDMEHTAGFRLNLGCIQAIWVKDRLKWATLDSYMHELLHAVWGGMEYLGIDCEESWTYLLDYLVRELTDTKL